jgi:hypothetical protein
MNPKRTNPGSLSTNGSPQYWQTILRWLHSPLLRAYEWRFFPSYWRTRNRWQRLKFAVSKRVYGARGGVRLAAESTSIFLLILKTVFWQVLAAAFLVAVLEFAEKKLRQSSSFLDYLTRHSAALRLAVTWFRHNPVVASISPGTFSTLAQISGLFLGLYFTAISVVAGTNYARVPTEILNALVREKVGNLYIRIVALFGGVSLILLGLVNLGYTPGTLNIILALLLGVASLFSFVELGRRAFYFFDPTKLVAVVATNILRLARSATPAGFSWRDNAFQDHYRKLADSDVRIYEDVVLLSDRESHLQGRSLLSLVLQLLVLLELYCKDKQRIPSDSLWFERVYHHRTWLTTEESRVNIAIETGTGLEPEYVADHSWLEKRLANLISRALTGLRDRADFARAITVSNKLQETLGILSGELAIDESLFLFQRLRTFAHAVATKTAQTPLSSDLKEFLAPSLGLADVCGMGFISIFLGFANRIEQTTAEQFSAVIDKVDFRRPRTLYLTGMPRKVVQQLEYLYKGIAFEARVEHQQLSPLWYCRQIAGLGMARFFVETCDTLLLELEKTFAAEAEQLSSEKCYPFAVQIVQRGLEACHKFHFRVEKLHDWFTAFSTLRRVPDIPWPDFDAKNTHQRIEAVRDRLLIVLANSVPGIAALPPSKDIPDYLGQAYVMLADECYRSMAIGDEALFTKLFHPFFVVATAVQDRLRVQLKDYEPKTAVIYVTEPIEDLMAISGYALVYSELDSKTFWNLVKTSWDTYFNASPDSAAIVKSLFATITYRRSLFSILPRDLRRTAWTQDLMHRLRQRGLADDLLGVGMFRNTEETPNHPSAIIRVLARNSFMFEKAADIFIACYLIERPEAAGLDVPTSVKDFVRRLQRENSKFNSEYPDET